MYCLLLNYDSPLWNMKKEAVKKVPFQGSNIEIVPFKMSIHLVMKLLTFCHITVSLFILSTKTSNRFANKSNIKDIVIYGWKYCILIIVNNKLGCNLRIQRRRLLSFTAFCSRVNQSFRSFAIVLSKVFLLRWFTFFPSFYSSKPSQSVLFLFHVFCCSLSEFL